MGKHSRRQVSTAKKTAVASVATLGATAVLAQPAQAAQVVVPNTNLSFDVAGIENVPNIQNIPGADSWIPSLSSQGQQVNYAAVVDVPKPAADSGQAIVDAAASKIGSQYVWGAAGPNAFDCSGLTSWAYQQVGKHIPRTSQAQAAGGTKIAKEDMRPGDIVVFYSGASHVGIYTGHGTVINAMNESTPLSETPLDYMPFHSAVRY